MLRGNTNSLRAAAQGEEGWGGGGEGHPLVKNKQTRLLDPITPVWSNARGGLNTGC